MLPDQPNQAYGPRTNRIASKAEAAADKAQELSQEIVSLRQRLDRLEMVVEALWTVVKSKTNASEAEALRLIEEIDLRDGHLNGRTVRAPESCARCSRVVSATTGICPYCGSQNIRATVF